MTGEAAETNSRAAVALRQVGVLLRRTPWLVGLPRDVVVLAAIAFCVALGFGIVVPAIPIFASSFGVSAFAAGAVISVFALFRFASAPASGALVNRAGERVVLATGLVIVAISSLLAGFAETYTHLLVMRGIGGAGSAMFTVSAMALLLRTTNRDQRGRAASAFQAGFLFGGVTGPAVGGLVVGISIRAPFFVYAGTLALATAVALIFLRPQARTSSDPGGTSDLGDDADQPARAIKLGAAIRQRGYQTALLANLNNGLVTFGLRTSLVPLFVVQALLRGPGWAAIGFLVSAACQAIALVPAGRITDHSGRKPAMVVGGVAMVVGITAFIVDFGLPTYLVGMAVLGVGAAFLGSAPAAVVGDVMGSHRGGTVVAAFQMISDVGAIFGPLIAGFVADRAGFHWAFATGLVTSVALVVMAVLMPETRAPGPLRRSAPT